MHFNAKCRRVQLPIRPLSRVRRLGGMSKPPCPQQKPIPISVPLTGSNGVPSFWLFTQELADGRRQFVRMLEKKAYLPKLGVRKAVAKTRHAGQPDAVLRLPIGFPRRIVGDTFLVRADKGRRLGIHSQSDRRGWPIRGAMTDHALCLVDLRTGGEVGLGRLHGRGFVCFAVDRRVKSNAREKTFEWQRLPFGSYRHSSRYNKEVSAQRKYADT